MPRELDAAAFSQLSALQALREESDLAVIELQTSLRRARALYEWALTRPGPTEEDEVQLRAALMELFDRIAVLERERVNEMRNRLRYFADIEALTEEYGLCSARFLHSE